MKKNRHSQPLLKFMAIAAILLFLANLAIDNPYTHAAVRYLLREKVLKTSPIDINYQSMKVGLFPPSVDLYGVRVTSKDQIPEELLSTSNLKINVSMWSLVVAQPRIGKIVIQDLVFSWPPSPSMQKVLDAWQNTQAKPQEPSAPATWPPAFDLPVDEIQLGNLNLYVTFPPFEPGDDAFSIAAESTDLNIRYNGWRDISTRLAVRKFNAHLGKSSIAEDAQVELRGDLAGNRLVAQKVLVTSPRLNADGSAEVILDSSPGKKILQKILLEADAQVDGDLSLLGSFLDIDDTKGRITGEAKVKTSIPIASHEEVQFEVSGSGRSHDSRLADFRLYDSAIKFRIDLDKIAFEHIDLMIGDKAYGTGDGYVGFSDGIPYHFNLRPLGLHFGDLLQVFNVKFDLLDFPLSSGAAYLEGKGIPFHMKVKGPVHLAELTLPTLSYDHRKFPRSPNCLVDLEMSINEGGADFAGSKATCYQDDQNKPVQVKDTAIPSQATAVSPLAVSGFTHFNDKKGMDLRFQSNYFSLTLGEYFAQVPLHGPSSQDVRIHGPYDRILVDIASRATDLSIAGAQLQQLQSQITVHADHLEWRDIDAETAGGGKISSPAGSLFFDDHITIKTQLEAHNWSNATSKDLWENILGAHSELTINDFKGDFTIALLQPAQASGQFSIAAEKFVLQGETIFDRAKAQFIATPQGWNVQTSELTLASMNANVTLEHRRSPAHTAARPAHDPWHKWGLAATDSVNIGFTVNPNGGDTHLQALPFAGSYFKTLPLKAQFQVQGKVSGTLGHHEVTLDGEIVNIDWMQAKAANVEVHSFLAQGKLDTRVQQSGGGLRGRFAIDLNSPGYDFDWYFQLAGFDMRPILGPTFAAEPRNFAYLSGSWQMRGKFTDWWHSQGYIRIDDVKMRVQKTTAIGPRSVDLNLAKAFQLDIRPTGWVASEEKSLYLTSENLNFRADFSKTSLPNRIDMQVEGILELTMLRQFIAQMESATGSLRISGKIKGSVTDPNVQFEIVDVAPHNASGTPWEPLSIGIANLRPPLKNIHTHLTLTAEGLTIDHFSADKGAGKLRASGNYYFASADKESNIVFNFDGIAIIYPVAIIQTFDMTLSGTMTLRGKSVPYNLEGDIEVVRARSNKEVSLRNEIVKSFREQSVAIVNTSLTPSFVYNINIHAPRSINLTNRNLQTIMSTSLQLGGTDIYPTLRGQMEVNRGKFIYKRNFDIQRGLINFDDPIRINPNLDISAQSDVGGYRVYINVSGRASDPVVDFSIEPGVRPDGTVISKVDIIVLLSRGSLPDSSVSSLAGQGAASAEVLNLFAGQIEDPLERLFDMSGQTVVRQIYIDTYPSEEGTPIPRFNLPLNISDDLDLVLKVDQQNLQVSSEYSLHDSITLSGGIEKKSETEKSSSTSTAPADTGVDLKFRFNFP